MPKNKRIRKRDIYKIPAKEDNTTNYYKLIIVIIISFVFIGGEILGGIISHSISVISDATHLITDLIGFIVSFIFIYYSSRSSDHKISFGFHRMEVLGALANLFIIWVIAIFLLYEATLRVINKEFVQNPKVMLIIAGGGLIVNIIMYFVLHSGGSHSHGLGNKCSHDHEALDDQSQVGLCGNCQQPEEKDHKCIDKALHDEIKLPRKSIYGEQNYNQQNKKLNQNQNLQQQQIIACSNCNSEAKINLTRKNLDENNHPKQYHCKHKTSIIKKQEQLNKHGGNCLNDRCQNHQQHKHQDHNHKHEEHKHDNKVQNHQSHHHEEGHSHNYQDHNKHDHKDHKHDHKGHKHNHKGQKHNHQGHNHDHEGDNHGDDHNHEHHEHGEHHHQNQNKQSISMKAAVLHALTDIIQSIGLLISSLLIFFLGSDYGNIVTEFNNWHYLDPITTYIFSILVIISTWPITKQCYNIILQATPEEIDTQKIRKDFQFQEVKQIHDFHIWELRPGKTLLTAHVFSATGKEKYVLQKLTRLCRKYKIYHTTIQVEEWDSKFHEDYIRCENDIH